MELTPQLIASMIGGKVEGDANVKITGFAKIEEAKPGCVTFIANPKYSHFIYETQASAVLVSDDFSVEKDVKPVLIRVKDPYIALADLMNELQKSTPKPKGIENPCFIAVGVQIPEDAYIGAFAYIGKDVKIGRGVQIYPQTYIGEGVKIGDGTIIRAGVKIYQECDIGKGCIIHSGAVIGADGFGFAPLPDGTYEKIPQIGNVVIEDYVEIGANTTVDRATFGCTRIGIGTKLDNLIQIAHNVEIGKGNVFAAQTGIAGSTKIGDYNQVGGQCGFAGHIKVGNMNQIGAQSGIHSNIGDRERLIGTPVVEAGQYARMQVYLKRLRELFNKNKD